MQQLNSKRFNRIHAVIFIAFLFQFFNSVELAAQVITSEVNVMANTATILQSNGQDILTVQPDGVSVNGNMNISGGLAVSGSISASNIETVKTITKQIALSTNWIDTGIERFALTNGTYVIQVYVNNYAVGGHHFFETYSGVMSWHSGETNHIGTSDIFLHQAGHASNAGRIYLRTARQWASQGGNLKLQIRSNANVASTSYTFKFKKII